MDVTANQSDDGKTLTISLTGRFDYTTYSNFIQACWNKLSYYGDKSRLPSRVVVDMAGVEYVDASALGMLLVLREKAIANRAEVVLSCCPPNVKKSIQAHSAGRLFNLD
ncbi:MAG: STAS domain-containing protein [Deltaproteobacteria bacterium]|nr:STAS domain-containing protein [Deltaproteobacteria bacterium]